MSSENSSASDNLFFHSLLLYTQECKKHIFVANISLPIAVCFTLQIRTFCHFTVTLDGHEETKTEFTLQIEISNAKKSKKQS